MIGAIRLRDVARHPVLVVCGFGWEPFLRCIWAALTRRRVTFLELAVSRTSDLASPAGRRR